MHLIRFTKINPLFNPVILIFFFFFSEIQPIQNSKPIQFPPELGLPKRQPKQNRLQCWRITARIPRSASRRQGPAATLSNAYFYYFSYFFFSSAFPILIYLLIIPHLQLITPMTTDHYQIIFESNICIQLQI